MDQNKCIKALLHIRKLRGGSQPILVRADDGFFYVVKFLNNLQGSNLLFNEALGTELFRRAGLLVPAWRPVYISEDFLDRYPACWMETENGRRRPKAGWCFGSRYLSLRNTALFEILPERSFSRIGNRRDFWTAWVLDTLCGHADNRQALFLERNSGSIEAYFIDHGHLFGGAAGTESPRFLASRYLDPRIYAKANVEDADEIQRAIQYLDLTAFSNVASSLPGGWCTEWTFLGFEHFARQISDPILLKDVVYFILSKVESAKGRYDRSQARCTVGFKRADMHGQVSPPGVDDRVDGRGCVFVGDQRRGGPQAVHPSYPRAANFL
jgi:hypothetical protein